MLKFAGRQGVYSAPAKVNLILRIVGKRSDGYHNLHSWMHKIDLNDTICLALTDVPGFLLECSTDEVPADETNLVYKAAVLFFNRAGLGKKYGVSIKLEKNIPVAAGLGGGSSDCAAVLKGLNELFDKPFRGVELEQMGLELGADVPFFVSEHVSALAEGVGEKLTPLPILPKIEMVIVNPEISVSTKWVYEKFILTGHNKRSNLTSFTLTNEDVFDCNLLYNDLEKVTEKRYPVIKEIKDSLLALGASGALMSGSGPTVFGIFPDIDKNSCKVIEDAVQTMRLRFRNKTYKVRTSAGA